MMKRSHASLVALTVLLFGSQCHEARCSEPLDTTVAQEGFVATYYDASEKQKPAGVIVLGGSEGGKPLHLAQQLAAEGYAAMALAYFKAPGTPDYLDEIPLEYFDKPMEWFASRPGMKGRKIVLVGASKGAELALLLASREAGIHGVIAISPSSVAFQGLPKTFWPPRSSWTSRGESIPFVPYDVSKGVDPENLVALYRASLSHADHIAEAAIPVERIAGPVLLLSGKEDSMWPSSEMADAIHARLKEHNFPYAVENIQYENAGHTLTEFFMIGGTEEGNRKARLDFWERMLAFLSANLEEAATESLPK